MDHLNGLVAAIILKQYTTGLALQINSHNYVNK